MKADSFSKEMGKIAAQAEQERMDELKAAQRALLFRRVRKVVLVALLFGAVGAGYAYRDELGHQCNNLRQQIAKVTSSSSSIAKTDSNLRGDVGAIQEVARKRNELVDEFAGGIKK